MSLVKVNARSSLEQYAFTLTSVTTGLIAVKTQSSTSGAVPVLFVFYGGIEKQSNPACISVKMQNLRLKWN